MRFHQMRVVLAALAVLYGECAGQEVVPPASDARTLLAGQLDLPRLLDLSAQRMKLNIEYDPSALKAAGSVTLRFDVGLSDEELWALTNRVLYARGYTTVRVPGRAAYTVVKLAEAAGVAGIAEGLPGEPGAGFRSAVVRAKHRTGKELVDAATKVLSKSGSSATVLREAPEGALILLSDSSVRIEQALSLFEMIDVPAEGVHVEDVPVRSYNAQQLATLVAQVNAKREVVAGIKATGEVIPSPDGGSVLIVCEPRSAAYWKELIANLDSRDRLETVTYSPRLFGLQEVATLMPGHPDPRMNPALTMERAGRTDEALTAYAAALEVYDGHMPTIQAKTRLQLKSGKTDDTTRRSLESIAFKGETESWRTWARTRLSRIEP